MSPPKCYRIYCRICGWKEYSTGLKNDLVHLKELKKGCSKCTKKHRNFKCPKCSSIAKMIKVNVY